MPYPLLKKIIAQLKKTCTCPSCGSRITEDAVFVLFSTFSSQTMTGQALFLVHCPNCLTQAFVISQITHNHLSMETKRTNGSISTNEILDMHNFLKEWQGDISDVVM